MRPTELVVVIGAGGHAKVVISTLRAAGHEVAAAFDDSPAKWGTRVLGVEVAGPVSALADRPQERAVIAIGDNRVRRAIASKIDLRWFTVIHPSAVVDPSVAIGPGSVVFAGAVVQPGASIGAHVVVNTGVIVEHDCTLGDYSQAASGTSLGGGVEVGEGTLLGVGTSTVPCVRIGAWSTVGAGSVVSRDLPDGIIAYGVPARSIRPV